MAKKARAVSEIMLPQDTVDMLVRDHENGTGFLSEAKEGFDTNEARIIYEISGNRIKVIYDFYTPDLRTAIMHGLEIVSKVSIRILAQTSGLSDENIRFQSVRGMWIDFMEA
ncbi:MAG: hypothetical protein M1605_03810 [Candidatus Thermoplasmatota archaeon]|nr:hypothetical protein [Candidatus Thermoplasmatota archaeon]